MTRFFLAENPGYQHGHGLVVLLPISLRTLVDGVVRHIRRELVRRVLEPQAISRA